jgi:hypothetical protein
MSGADLFTAAAVTCVPHATPKPTSTRGKPVMFNVFDGEDVRTITPRGRDAWALGELISARADGCTPITHVGPRWSHYIWKLRTVYGLAIESVEEQHGGEFSGRHVRYVLRSRVQFASPADATPHGGDQ